MVSADEAYVIYLRREDVPTLDSHLASTSELIARELRSSLIAVSARRRTLDKNNEVMFPLGSSNLSI